MHKIGKQLGKPSKAIYFKFFLRITYLALMIIALLGPSFGISETEARSSGKDIFFAVDLSASMDCTDVSPSRLEKVKIEITNLIEQSKGDRYGVMVFSSKAYWQIPLTFDVNLVKEFIAGMNTDMMPNPGSNLEAPLSMIQQKFSQNQDKTRSQIAFVFTDGESYSEVTEETLSKMKQEQKQLVIVGVGTEVGSDILENNSPLLLEDGSLAISRLDLNGLKEVSRNANAKLYTLSSEQDNLELAVQDIKNLKSAVIDRNKLMVANNKFQNFLLAAFILVALDILISTKVFQI
ncbi:VWA domain-containing protein [uncultured Arcticibacterium sp.]|uniref:vWA domain-containing protein n=1 Tax=uncultured Arcticibacterium sp. TaxID=2173042 RepID=UPI0030F5770B